VTPGAAGRPAPRRVVVALHLPDPSGPWRSLQPALDRLAARGAEIVVAVPRIGRVATELTAGARAEATGHGPLMLPRRPAAAAATAVALRADARRFRALLRREHPDLVIVATTTLPALVLAARRERVPTIVYAAELYRQGAAGDRLRSRIGRGAIRLNERLATVTVPCSHAVAGQLRHPDRAIVFYSPIGPAEEGDGDALRRRHAIPGSGPVIATIGNIARGRGQDVAIRALAELRRERPGARLVIAGTPHPRPMDEAFAEEIDALAASLGVAEAVHRVGFVRPADVFAVADVVVNPARFAETFGIVAMEALAAGRPVVSTHVGAVPEVLRDGEHALLVPPDRPEALVAAIGRLLDDPALAARLVARGREHVGTAFSAERVLPRFDEAVAAALAGGTR
jgi:glycosyltransferase involved in cell wall biosynthesis